MAFTKEDVRHLIALQEQDAALDKIKAIMEKIPVMIGNLKAQFEQEKTAAAELKNKSLALEKKKKEKELELAQKEEAAKKHGGELNAVKTNEAFKALQAEIERAKSDGSNIETEILVLMDQIDAARKEEKAAAAALAVEQKKFEAEIAAHEARLNDTKNEHDRAKAERDLAAAPIPAEAMRVYDHVRSRGKLDAIVPIDASMCSACRITLAPQVLVEATKLKALVVCESCQRILYRPETVNAPAKTTA